MSIYDQVNYNNETSSMYNNSNYGTTESLKFYSGQSDQSYYQRQSLEGQRGTESVNSNYGTGIVGSIANNGDFWSAFGTGGIEGEPPLLEELGINFDHIKRKSFAVLNPFRTIDQHLMDDTDLAGPLVFCFCFAMFLLFSGKPQFGYIYGLALLGDFTLYLLLNLMSETGIDAYRVASVLGYCLLPLVLLSFVTVIASLDGILGYLLSALSIFWCSYSASGIFVSVLQMSEQRILVAYPVGLFYATFALLSVFDAKTGTLGARLVK
ncbi:vesicle-mediated transporter [Phakopsora pachyrhizi]|uniref:Protein YIP n=1 Tax=Phakopsora pachyrhizi TaxID=170000 RepID=A0AAV0B523_PHAPC|nr:vesicle-mediated transporter [Phakopsora pachyrhizi]KAI8446000.1 vesicle-mediated transporter [Phakopsora pachyrhizi]CAH7677429.1 vesicle-mediated transporter [Phakopsora pachyrhizi]CAH7687701.1 vesicle-mediated transporter [Phakopsora pachyrhizi]